MAGFVSRPGGLTRGAHLAGAFSVASASRPAAAHQLLGAGEGPGAVRPSHIRAGAGPRTRRRPRQARDHQDEQAAEMRLAGAGGRRAATATSESQERRRHMRPGNDPTSPR